MLVGPRFNLRAADHSRLDLDEDERVPVAGNQVDLSVTGAHVTRDHHVADPSQMRGCELLATPAKRAPRLVDWLRPGASRSVGRDHLRQTRNGLGDVSAVGVAALWGRVGVCGPRDAVT